MLVRCEKCGGSLIVASLRTARQEVWLVGTLAGGTSLVEARVCRECGFTSFYAQTPHALQPYPVGSHPTSDRIGTPPED